MSHHHDDCEICFKKACSCLNEARKQAIREDEAKQRILDVVQGRFATDDERQCYLVVADSTSSVYTKADLIKYLPMMAYRAANKPSYTLTVARLPDAYAIF